MTILENIFFTEKTIDSLIIHINVLLFILFPSSVINCCLISLSNSSGLDTIDISSLEIPGDLYMK